MGKNLIFVSSPFFYFAAEIAMKIFVFQLSPLSIEDFRSSIEMLLGFVFGLNGIVKKREYGKVLPDY